MDDILRDFAERKSITVAGRMRYAILDKNKLQHLKGKFSGCTKTFEQMLSLLNMEAHDVQIRNNVVSQGKLDDILHTQSKEAIDRQIEAQKGEKSRQTIEKVLKILEQRPIAYASSATIQDQTQVLDQLETELRRLGLPDDKAKAVRLKASQELSGQPLPNPFLKVPDDKAKAVQPEISQKPSEQLRVSDDKAKTVQLKASQGFSGQPRASPFSLTGINPKVMPQTINPSQISAAGDCRILCVDGTHGSESSGNISTCFGLTDILKVRSILTQTYLELMRAFTAIQSPQLGHWLFKRVESAGFDVGAGREPTAIAAIQKGIHKLVSPYDQPTSKITEVSRIREFMTSYGHFAFTKSDFMTYHYILFFGPYTDRINQMRAEVQTQNTNVPLARIVMLEGCDSISTLECILDGRNIGKLIESIKAAVKKVMAQPPFNWSPSILTSGIYPHRMLQFITDEASLKYLIPGAGESLQGGQKLKEIENKTDCSVKVTKRLGMKHCVLVSIIGPQERLSEARGLIVASS